MAQAVYEVRGVTKRYRAAERPANDAVGFDVRPGEVFGVLGPNGAGKSTLIRQMVGLLRPDSGRILLFGDRDASDARSTATLVAYLPQAETALGDMTAYRAVETTARLRGAHRRAARSSADAVIAELGMEALAGRTVGRLSGGERRLVGVATALVGDRPVLVLDEPTTGLDPTARRAVWAALDRRRAEDGTTVVLVTHNVLEAETVLDRVLLLDGGRVVGCDTPGRLKQRLDGSLRLELAWRDRPPLDLPQVAALACRAAVSGRRWTLRLPEDEARSALGHLTAGPALAALDDFSLTTPSLEDIFVALGTVGWEAE